MRGRKLTSLKFGQALLVMIRPPADRLLDRIEQVCALLATHPHAGKQRDDLAPGLRFYPVGNHLVFYVPCDDGIAVARILHGARDYRQEFR